MSAPADLRIPSPLQRLDIPLAKAKNVELYIKRDDLIHPFVSGNKWRKLWGYITRAKELEVKQLISFGGAYSNHLLALAAAGSLLGFETLGYVRGEQPGVEGHMLKLCRSLGMKLQFLSRIEFSRIKREMPGSTDGLYIPEGGYGSEGLQGFQAFREEIPFIPDHIITPVGTGTTLAGIAAAYKGSGACVEGIVVLKGMDSLPDEIGNLLIGSDHAGYKLHHDFHEGGYAKVSDEIRVFIRSFTMEAGILTDPIYTAKMMMGALTLLERDYFRPGCKIVCVHTGGLMGGLSLL